MKTAALITNRTELIPAPSGLAIHEHPAVGYLAALRTDDGRRVQTQALATVARLLRPDLGECDHKTAILAVEWHTLNNAHLKAIATKLGEMHSPKTANRKLDAVRGVLKQAWLNGLMTRDEYERAVTVERIPGERLKRGRDVSAGEIQALFVSCRNENTILAGRDAALLALLFGCGLRRAEAAALTVGDWDAGKGVVTIRRGKGNKQRETPLPAGSVRALSAWLAHRGELAATAPLLCPMVKGDKIQPRPMTTQAIWKAVLQRAKKAGIAAFTPHDARRTVAGDLLESGADLSTVQKILGHADPKVTAEYDRRPAEERRRAINNLHVPFV